MTQTLSPDVLVGGAGPVGLTLAIDLARRGIPCRIIDQASTYPIGTRARGVSPRTQEIFADLGILEPLPASVEPNRVWRFYDGNNQLVRESNQASNPAAFPTPGWVVGETTWGVVGREGKEK